LFTPIEQKAKLVYT